MENSHPLMLGKLVANLQSLECLLRMYLLAAAPKGGVANKKDYFTLDVGDEVAVDNFTSYDSLGMLAKKFNKDVATRDRSLMIDEKVVEIRDLLAHGRIASTDAQLSNSTVLRIVKFDRPINGAARVIACASMDEAWFATNIKLVFDQLVKVHRANETLAD